MNEYMTCVITVNFQKLIQTLIFSRKNPLVYHFLREQEITLHQLKYVFIF